MDTSSIDERSGWQFGLDPAAPGSVIRSMTQILLPIGEALRIEMEPSSAGRIHVQYHVATESGGWALWFAAGAAELATVEARLAAFVAPDQADTLG